jgi:hypothetical protein
MSPFISEKHEESDISTLTIDKHVGNVQEIKRFIAKEIIVD